MPVQDLPRSPHTGKGTERAVGGGMVSGRPWFVVVKRIPDTTARVLYWCLGQI